MLYSRLYRRFPGMEFYAINVNKVFIPEEIKIEDFININKRTKNQNSISKFSILNFSVIIGLLIKLKSTLLIVKKFQKKGLDFKNIIGHLLRNESIINLEYDLVYYNALQSVKHLPPDVYFPKAHIIASSRGKDFDYDFQRTKNAIGQVNNLHVISDYLKSQAIKAGFSPEKIIKIYPANTSSFPDSNRWTANNEINVCTIARFTWEKGLVYSIRAVAELIKKMPSLKINYYLIGDGIDLEKLKIEAIRLGVEDFVHFTGWLSQKDIEIYISKSDIYLLLSISEGFNNSVIQAQYYGIPCVVSNAGGLSENVLHNKTGIVVEKYNSQAAATAMEDLIEDSEKRSNLSINAVEHARKNYNFNDQVDRYEDWINSSLNKSDNN